MCTEHKVNEPIAKYEIIDGAKKKWTLTLYTNYLRLETVDSEPHDIQKGELRERIQTIDNLLIRRFLSVNVGEQKFAFCLSPEVFAAVMAWIGPPTIEDLKLSLKRRLGWVFPVGLLFVLGELIVGTESSWDPFWIGMGLTLILLGALAKFFPHRILFALDSLWFVSLATHSAWLLAQEWSWMGLVLLLMQLALARSGWREYHRFAPEGMHAEP